MIYLPPQNHPNSKGKLFGKHSVVAASEVITKLQVQNNTNTK